MIKVVFLFAVLSQSVMAQYPWKHIRVGNDSDVALQVRCDTEPQFRSLETGAKYHCDTVGAVHILIDGEEETLAHEDYCSSATKVLLVTFTKDQALDKVCL